MLILIGILGGPSFDGLPGGMLDSTSWLNYFIMVIIYYLIKIIRNRMLFTFHKISLLNTRCYIIAYNAVCRLYKDRLAGSKADFNLAF